MSTKRRLHPTKRARSRRLGLRFRQEKHRDVYDWATLCVAVLGVVVIAASAVISTWQAMLSREQVFVANRQLQHSIEQNRPRLKITASFNGGRPVEDFGERSYSESPAKMNILLQNTGSSTIDPFPLFIRIVEEKVESEPDQGIRYLGGECFDPLFPTAVPKMYPDDKRVVSNISISEGESEINDLSNQYPPYFLRLKTGKWFLMFICSYYRSDEYYRGINTSIAYRIMIIDGDPKSGGKARVVSERIPARDIDIETVLPSDDAH